MVEVKLSAVRTIYDAGYEKGQRENSHKRWQ